MKPDCNERLRQQGTTIISVGHRHSLEPFHDWLQTFDGGGHWQCRATAWQSLAFSTIAHRSMQPAQSPPPKIAPAV